MASRFGSIPIAITMSLAVICSACTANDLSQLASVLKSAQQSGSQQGGQQQGGPQQGPGMGRPGFGPQGGPGMGGPGMQQRPGMGQQGQQQTGFGTAMPTQTTGTPDPSGTRTPTTVSSDVPEVYKALYGASSLTVDGDYLVITSKGEPDHDSPYYTGSMYTPDPNSGFSKNPNSIQENDLTFRIPLHPTEATTHQATHLGPIGIALDGVPYYNQYNTTDVPLTSEIVSFDQFNGHPDQEGAYHYHVEPVYLTAKYGRDALLGFLLDGFPVYGPEENGKILTSADLDAYHGHFGPTKEFPNGIYHYHITADAPYINGDGYYGTPGTVTWSGMGTGARTSGSGSPPPSGTTQPPPGGTPPSGCPTPPPQGSTPAPPPPGGWPSYCPAPPGGWPSPPPKQ